MTSHDRCRDFLCQARNPEAVAPSTGPLPPLQNFHRLITVLAHS